MMHRILISVVLSLLMAFNTAYAKGNENTSLYNVNYRSAIDGLKLDAAAITTVSDRQSMQIKGLETICIDAVYADTSVIVENREDIAVFFQAEGKLIDNLALICESKDAQALIAVQLKDDKQGMAVTVLIS